MKLIYTQAICTHTVKFNDTTEKFKYPKIFKKCKFILEKK